MRYNARRPGTVVYLREIGSAPSVQAAEMIASRGVRELPAQYQLASSGDTTLIFESRFESGNLLKAAKM